MWHGLFTFVDEFFTIMARRLIAVILSVLMLVPGWLGATGLTLLAAFVPLLWLSAEAEDSRRGWWRTLGWSAMAFVLWNVLTVWWIWNATPVGPVAATVVSTFWNLLAFMAFHTISKRAPKSLAYTALVAIWITTEYWYTVGEISWPWLILGNGFSHDIWAVQWYEYTGVFGGSAWVLISNILIFEAWRARRNISKWVAAAAFVVVPMVVSYVVGSRAGDIADGGVRVAIIQPNVDCYDKFHDDHSRQERNIIDLLSEVPADADFVLLPETAVPAYYWEPALSKHLGGGMGGFWLELRDSLRAEAPGAMLVTGANTLYHYRAGTQPRTAREFGDGNYYDHFNTAVGLDTAACVQLHHKGRLVIGVENTPGFIFDLMDFLVIDLGGIVGQIGIGRHGSAFEHNGVKVGPAICYEGLYGDFFADFVRRGAGFMAIISNDGWWGDTPGYRHLFTISRLRAIETRRAIARSANTGMSGFISPTGRVGETLGWEERGVITARVPLNSETTFYVKYGDWIGRTAKLLSLLCILYFVAYRVRRRNHLV